MEVVTLSADANEFKVGGLSVGILAALPKDTVLSHFLTEVSVGFYDEELSELAASRNLLIGPDNRFSVGFSRPSAKLDGDIEIYSVSCLRIYK